MKRVEARGDVEPRVSRAVHGITYHDTGATHVACIMAQVVTSDTCANCPCGGTVAHSIDGGTVSRHTLARLMRVNPLPPGTNSETLVGGLWGVPPTQKVPIW